MNADDRFDRLVRDSLAWQAERSQAAQPSFDVAINKLVQRLDGRRSAVRPTIRVRPATSSAASAIMLILLLVALLATAVLVGSQLLRELSPPRPGPFGFASDCPARLPEGVAIEVYVDDRPTTILSDGTVFTEPSSAAGVPISSEPPTGGAVDSRVETIRSTAYGHRQLTERGLALLTERVTDAGLTTGCIALRSSGSQGSISALTPSGYAQLTWHPEAGRFSFARPMSPAEEEQALELQADLSTPDEWLPAEAWADPAVSTVMPQRWLVTIQFIQTDLPPGAVVGLPNGQTLEGSDPRYDLVVLPGGEKPLTFGTEYPPEGASYLRCGIVETSDALRLAESLDSTFGSETDWFLHTPDMAHEVTIGITPAFPPGFDCDAAIAARSGEQQSASPRPTGEPASGEFVEVDPCSLLPSALMLDGRPWTDGQRSERSELPVGRPARACWLLDTSDPSYEARDESSAVFARRISLTLYPDKLATGAARDIAEAVLGHDAVETEIANRPVWENDCLNAAKPCAPLAAFWHEGRLFFVQFDYQNLVNPVLPLDRARARVSAIIEALE